MGSTGFSIKHTFAMYKFKKKKMTKQLISALLIFGLISATTFVSCKKDNTEPSNTDENTQGNTDTTNQQTNCFRVVDLTNYVGGPQTINFINGAEGWIVAKNSDDMNKRTLINTVDSGLTWTVINTDLNVEHKGSVSAPYIQFYNSTNGFMIGKYNISLGGSQLKYTTDKGQTWTVINGSAIGTWDVMAVNSTDAVFIGHTVQGFDNGVLYKVSNASHEITLTVDLPSTLDLYAKVDMNLADDGTINVPVSRVNAGSGLYMARSVDYGANWTFSAIDLEYIYNVDFPTNNIGYVLGDYDSNASFMYKTTDGGITWTKKSLPQSFIHHDFFDGLNGLCVNEGVIYKTTDGAETWAEVSCFSNSEHQPSRGVAFISNNKWLSIGGRYVSSENKTYQELYIYP